MAHYDFMYERQSREDIETDIIRNETLKERAKSQQNHLVFDLGKVTHSISLEALKEVIRDKTIDIERYADRVSKLNDLLARHDNGEKITWEMLPR